MAPHCSEEGVGVLSRVSWACSPVLSSITSIQPSLPAHPPRQWLPPFSPSGTVSSCVWTLASFYLLLESQLGHHFCREALPGPKGDQWHILMAPDRFSSCTQHDLCNCFCHSLIQHMLMKCLLICQALFPALMIQQEANRQKPLPLVGRVCYLVIIGCLHLTNHQLHG